MALTTTACHSRTSPEVSSAPISSRSELPSTISFAPCLRPIVDNRDAREWPEGLAGDAENKDDGTQFLVAQRRAVPVRIKMYRHGNTQVQPRTKDLSMSRIFRRNAAV